MPTTKPKTIAKSRKARIEAIFAAATTCTRHDSDNYYRGSETRPEHARRWLTANPYAKLSDMGGGLYHVTVHCNLWYEVRSNG